MLLNLAARIADKITMVKRIIRLASVFLVIAFLVSRWTADPVPPAQVFEKEKIAEAPLKKMKARVGRAPASSKREEFVLREAERKIALGREQEFRDTDAQPLGEAIEPRRGYIPLEQNGPLNRSVTAPAESSVAKKTPSQATDGTVTFSNQGFPAVSTPTTAAPPAPRRSSGSSNDSERAELTCTASIGAGTYSSPRTVAITCSSTAEIRYCLQENTCCDPRTGVSYTGPFTVGTTVGDFCLSIQGENDEGPVVSDVAQIDLQFNPDVPHLVVDHTRRFWQTGQLSAQMAFVSDNFGSPNLEAGILNLLTNDPSAAGLNMTCEQIVEDYTTLTTPAPLVVMPGMAVDSLSPTIQLDAWLTTTQLNYGDNNVTTYLMNNNYGSESFACTTTKLVLEDFEYFTAEAPQIADATGLDGYVFGGFTTYGHFEEDPVLNRSPAGSMIDSKQDQELRTGMLGIFF